MMQRKRWPLNIIHVNVNCVNIYYCATVECAHLVREGDELGNIRGSDEGGADSDEEEEEEREDKRDRKLSPDEIAKRKKWKRCD